MSIRRAYPITSGLAISKEWTAAAILALAVSFNLILAAVNAHVFALTRTHVILAEMSIVGAAVLTCIVFWTPYMLRWVWLAWFMIITFLILSFANGAIEIKLIRDVIIIPVFAMLGMVYAKGNIIRLVCILQVLVVTLMVLEGASPQLFGQIFDVQGYYINTRGFVEDAFWNQEANLFVSSYRPNSRFLFEGLNIHRLSSIHLEPVSLGNWAIIVTIFLLAYRHRMNLATITFLTTTILLVLIGCDGRLATVTIAVLAVTSLVFPYLPRYFHLSYLPLCIGLGAAIVYGLGLAPGGDNFPGRLAGSINHFFNLGLSEYFGVTENLGTARFEDSRGADSGITYFTLTQSIVGFVVIWVGIGLLQPLRTRESIIFAHCTALYVSLTLLVSYSFFSIKTAAILWFLYGLAARQSETSTPAASVNRPQPFDSPTPLPSNPSMVDQ